MRILHKWIGYTNRAWLLEGCNLKRKKRIPRKRTVKKPLVVDNDHRSPILPAFTSVNISKMLSHFMTFRSAIRDLSSSIQRMEKMLDTTYQMFEIVHNVIKHRHQPIQSLLPPELESPHANEPKDDFPFMNRPSENESNSPPSFSQLFSQIDPNFFIQLLKSPMFQRLISQFLASPKNASLKVHHPIRRGKRG